MPDMSPKKAGVLVGNFSAPGKVYTEALMNRPGNPGD